MCIRDSSSSPVPFLTHGKAGRQSAAGEGEPDYGHVQSCDVTEVSWRIRGCPSGPPRGVRQCTYHATREESTGNRSLCGAPSARGADFSLPRDGVRRHSSRRPLERRVPRTSEADSNATQARPPSLAHSHEPALENAQALSRAFSVRARCLQVTCGVNGPRAELAKATEEPFVRGSPKPAILFAFSAGETLLVSPPLPPPPFC